MKDNAKIKTEIEALPKGYISKKTIKGNTQYYLQWTENKKKKSKYINSNDVDKIRKLIELRKKYEKQLEKEDCVKENRFSYFNTNILIGYSLTSFISSVQKYKKRDIYKTLNEYINSNNQKVFILYGLRRTGKTTMIKQVILSMNKEKQNKTAFIQITNRDNFQSLNRDLKELKNQGYKYVFIDEITQMDDFIDGSAILSDIYITSGMKIVLSGTDSLGFMIAKNYQLYDRSILLHTTIIPYREFERVLGIKGLDKYIEYGGTMSISGKHYNDSIFSNKESTDEYIDSSITHNIQHSLNHYQDGGHFRSLYKLFEKNELTSAINRIIEDMNHRFTIEVLTRVFKSNDLSLSKNNLRKENDILDYIDIEAFNKNLKKSLDILNKNEQTIDIKEIHQKEIKEYLKLLDLIDEIDIKSIDGNINKRIIFTQPGMRYCQAKLIIKNLLKDKVFNKLDIKTKKYIEERILNEIKGRMMEDIVLYETTKNNENKEVFKLQFAIGEYDMVIFDYDNLDCELYEIKHSDKIADNQSRFLKDKTKLKQVNKTFGEIKKKVILYEGETFKSDDVDYINVEEYLTKKIIDNLSFNNQRSK